MSYWEGWVECAKRAYLQGLAKDGDGATPNKYAVIGTILHKFQELYHLGKLHDTGAVKFHDLPDDSALQIAEVVFRAYRARHPRTFWGRNPKVEKLFKGDRKEIWGSKPPDNFEVSGKYDLVGKLTKTRIAAIGERYPHLKSLKPGTYGLDWKTCSQIDDQTVLRYSNSLQLGLYDWAGQQRYQDWRGMIAVLMTRSKSNPKVHPLPLKPVRQEQKARVRNALKLAWYRRGESQLDKLAKPAGNPFACFKYNNPCPFFQNGCSGY